MHNNNQVQQWRSELQIAETTARELQQWIKHNPCSAAGQLQEKKQQLMLQLHKINDLVMLIKAPVPYKIS